MERTKKKIVMDYEQKYKEALKDMRAIYPNLKGDAKLAVEHAFPELAESEDERIRRTLVEYFGPMAQLDFVRGVPIQKIRDWLEKPKESLHIHETRKENANSFTDEDEKIRKKLIWQVQMNVEDETADLQKSVYNGVKGHDPDLEESIEDWKKCLAWLEKQKEPINPFDTKLFQDGVKEGRRLEREDIKKEQQSFREGAESVKPAEWSEEDAMLMDELESYILYDKEFNDEQKSWRIKRLKSLCPSKDCSGCAKHLEGYISGRSDAENKLLEQFGALVTPEGELHIKPRWEPSEEQMKALYCALNDAISLYSDKVSPLYEEISRTHFDALESLYNDLKKL